MPSKSSKNLPPANPPAWKEDLACDEAALGRFARAVAAELRPGNWLLLEGPMGAGKSTFARRLLKELGFSIPAEGSPTFALAHDYSEAGRPHLIHLDLYRLEGDDELEAAGIPAYFWENPTALVMVEWTSRFPALEQALLEDHRRDRWKLLIDFTDSPNQRRVQAWRYPQRES